MDDSVNLQLNLRVIRTCAGWTSEDLAQKLDVSRPTISALEQNSKKSTMSRLQYLAIRKILDDEIATHKDDTCMLALVLDALVDHPESYTKEARDDILSKSKLLAPAIMKQPSERKSISNAWKSLLIAGGIVAVAAIAVFYHGSDS